MATSAPTTSRSSVALSAYEASRTVAETEEKLLKWLLGTEKSLFIDNAGAQSEITAHHGAGELHRRVSARRADGSGGV